MIVDRVSAILVDKLSLDASEITMDSTFKDLDIDSLDLFDILMEIEEQFGIEIPTEEASNFTTVGDVVNYIGSKQ